MAKTKVEMGETWTCKLSLLNARDNAYNATPINTLGFSAMGCTASIGKRTTENPDGYYYGPAHEHAWNDPPPIPGQMGVWNGRYYTYNVVCSGPGLANTITIPLYVWLYDYFYMQAVGSIPSGGVACTDDVFELNVSISVSGLFLKAQIDDDSPADRQMMDFTDLSADYLWYADEATSSSITISGGGISETKTGTWGSWSAGDEVDILVGETFSCGYSIGANWGTDGDRHGSISEINWGSLGTISCSGIEKLYTTDGTTWSRTVATGNFWKFYDGNEISIERYGTSTTSDASWSGGTGAPYIVEFKMDGDSTGYFDEDGASLNLVFLSNYIVWDDEEAWHYEPISNGQIVTQAASTWNEDYPSEWQNLSSREIVVWEREAERNAYDDDVITGVGMSQDDAQCQIPIPKLDATTLELSSYSGCFWANLISASHDTSISVNDPGTLSRPSSWVAGTVDITVSGDSDIWTVAASSSNLSVYRDLKTRFWLRMNRLSGGYNAGDEYGTHWPYMLKANLDDSITLDDADWITAIAYEDIYNWSNFKYLSVDITAPYAGEITLQIDFDVPSVSDPCYSCAEFRFDEYEYSVSSNSLTYTFDVVAGQQTILIDLACNNEKVLPIKSYRLHIIKKVVFRLPNNTEETTQEFVLNDLVLTLDDGGNDRTEPAEHSILRYKRCWDWIGEHWIGATGIVDGLPALEISYGFGTVKNDLGIPYIQKVQHCPTTQDQTVRLDFARDLSSLAGDIDMQEGWSADYTDQLETAGNMDEDDVKLVSSWYYWDLRNDLEAASNSGNEIFLSGCKQVGTYKIPAGCKATVWVVKHPRGRIQGLLLDEDYTTRLRSETDKVSVYEKKDSGSWTSIATLSTDSHGRFFDTRGLRESATDFTYQYKVNQSSSYSAVTREYITVPTVGVITGRADICRGPDGNIYMASISPSGIDTSRWNQYQNQWDILSTPYNRTFSNPSIAVDDNGWVFVSAESAGAATCRVLKDINASWENYHMLDMFSDLVAVDIYSVFGMLWGVGYDATNSKVVIRGAAESDVAYMELDVKTSVALVDDRNPFVSSSMADDGSIFVVIETSAGTETYRCQNILDAFSQV